MGADTLNQMKYTIELYRHYVTQEPIEKDTLEDAIDRALWMSEYWEGYPVKIRCGEEILWNHKQQPIAEYAKSHGITI